MNFFKRKELNTETDTILTMLQAKDILQKITFSWSIIHGDNYQLMHGYDFNFILNEITPYFLDSLKETERKKATQLTSDIGDLDNEIKEFVQKIRTALDKIHTNHYLTRRDKEEIQKAIKANAKDKALKYCKQTTKVMTDYFKIIEPYFKEFNRKIGLYYPDTLQHKKGVSQPLLHTKTPILKEFERGLERILFDGNLRPLESFDMFEPERKFASNFDRYTAIGEYSQYSFFVSEIINEYVPKIAKKIQHYPEANDRYRFVERNIQSIEQVEDFEEFLKEKYEAERYQQEYKALKVAYFKETLEERNNVNYDEYVENIKKQAIIT